MRANYFIAIRNAERLEKTVEQMYVGKNNAELETELKKIQPKGFLDTINYFFDTKRQFEYNYIKTTLEN